MCTNKPHRDAESLSGQVYHIQPTHRLGPAHATTFSNNIMHSGNRSKWDAFLAATSISQTNKETTRIRRGKAQDSLDDREIRRGGDSGSIFGQFIRIAQFSNPFANGLEVRACTRNRHFLTSTDASIKYTVVHGYRIGLIANGHERVCLGNGDRPCGDDREFRPGGDSGNIFGQFMSKLVFANGLEVRTCTRKCHLPTSTGTYIKWAQNRIARSLDS